ncbi:MAG: hypothetical protein HRU03_01530 [Nanoarchaeales archaeon]|nr:hypothetical protein [Nanoarchaeales archaeon]
MDCYIKINNKYFDKIEIINKLGFQGLATNSYIPSYMYKIIFSNKPKYYASRSIGDIVKSLLEKKRFKEIDFNNLEIGVLKTELSDTKPLNTINNINI